MIGFRKYSLKGKGHDVWNLLPNRSRRKNVCMYVCGKTLKINETK